MKLNELLGVQEEVERRLQRAQEKKEFKDAGERIGGSAKEKRAINAIKLADLANIEKDEATAVELIVKDRIWPKYNPENELNNGVSSGCAYLKQIIRSGYGAKPKMQTHQARRAYIGFAELLQGMFSNCFSILDIINTTKKLKSSNASEFPFLFTEDELSQFSEAELNKRYSGNYVYLMLMSRIIGTECYNLLFQKSEAAVKQWKKAIYYDGVTSDMEFIYRETHKLKYSKLIEENQAKIIEVTTANHEQLRDLKSSWRNVPSNIEEFRAKLLEIYESRLKIAETGIKTFPKELQVRDPDWSWTDKKIAAKTKAAPELIINQPPPLDYIKRTGGIEITVVKETEIIDQFGFKYVEFGNSIPDKLAREHIRHFLGAMCDLFETLNIHHSELNKIGELSIAFASRGKKGSAAHYNVNRKIININRRNGDGSVAHEWMHFIDHLIWLKLGNNAENHPTNLASTRLDNLKNTNTAFYFETLVNALIRGDGLPKSITQSYRARSDKPYSRLMKETVEETLDYLRLKHPFIFSDRYSNSNREARDIFGYVAHHFNLNRVHVQRSITRKSLFYMLSSQMNSEYWIKPFELLARAFETYIADKLNALGRANNYLVSDSLFEHQLGIYPLEEEREFFKERFDDFFQSLKTEFNIPDFSAFSERRVDEYIVFDEKENTEEKEIKTGVIVVSDLSELIRLEIELFKAA